MVEVIVAIALLTVLVVSLAGSFQSAVDRARATRDELRETHPLVPGEPSSAVLAEESASAWRWGAQVVKAMWQPGPALRVLCAGEREVKKRTGENSLLLGVWIEGWFRGEQAVTEGDFLTIEDPNLAEESGSELVVRVRSKDGVWGPPWRTVVPDSRGELTRGPSVLKPSLTSEPLNGAENLVHLPGLGNPGISASPNVVQVERDASGAILILRSVAQGRADLTLGDFTQSWLAFSGRAIDVYF